MFLNPDVISQKKANVQYINDIFRLLINVRVSNLLLQYIRIFLRKKSILAITG